MKPIDFTILILFVLGVGLYFSDEIIGCSCADGTAGCPCPNQETLKYFKDNCEGYFNPSSSSSMLEMTETCNEELNKSLLAFK